MVDIIDPLDGALRALRTIQAPQQVTPVGDGSFQVSSAAFRPQSDGSFSVDLEESLRRSGLTLTDRYPGVDRAVALTAHPVSRFTSEGLDVRHVPIVGNIHHGEIRGDGLTKGRLRSIARALADECEMVVPINVREIERLQSG